MISFVEKIQTSIMRMINSPCRERGTVFGTPVVKKNISSRAEVHGGCVGLRLASIEASIEARGARKISGLGKVSSNWRISSEK